MKTAKMSVEQVLTQATDKLVSEITNLSDERDQSLSIFRQTAQQLAGINTKLNTDIERMTELEQFIGTQKAAAGQIVSDNQHVIDKIYEIIGK
jgi:predicted transglutaminase-like cysteine proteinase